MTREDIICMARVSGCHDNGEEFRFVELRYLERFAALVAAAKDKEHKEAMRWDIHSCGPTCTRYACVATRKAVAAEREACARVVEESSLPDAYSEPALLEIANDIRARGQA